MYFVTSSDIPFQELAQKSSKNRSFMVFVAEKSASEVDFILQECNAVDLVIFGGVFPAVIVDTEHFDTGILILSIPQVEAIIPLREKDNEEIFKHQADLKEIRTALLFTDGLMGETDAFLRKVVNTFGNTLNVIGGGAGFMTLKQQPCIFTNEGIFQDGGVIALLKNSSKIGVKHGWDILEGPFLATSTDKNCIKELNWRPAFEVYQEVIENNSDYRFTPTNFFEIAKNFPFGIYKDGTEIIVRDPFVVTAEEGIMCLSEVPENSTLQILQGNPTSLIAAAHSVAIESITSDKEAGEVFLFDCISRVMFLGDKFKDELKAIKKHTYEGKAHLRGVATLGEIATAGNGFVEFFNKTIVACNLNSQ